MDSHARLHAELIVSHRQHCPVADQRHLVLMGWLVTGLLLSQTVYLGQWKRSIPLGRSLASSWQRRSRRWLSNSRIDVQSLYGPLVLWPMQQWHKPGETLHLAHDTSMLWNRFLWWWSPLSAGLSRHLQAAQCSVREVNRPNRQTRSQRGKDDAIDAEAAARSLLAGTATAVAKTGNADAEILRVLKSTRDSAVRCRTRAITHLKALLIVVPAELRETFQHLDSAELVNRCLQRNEDVATNPLTAAWMAMRFLAERIRHLEKELMVLGRQLDRITQAIAPDLRAAKALSLTTPPPC